MFYLINSLFGGFGSILLLALFIVAFVKISNLKTRVNNLERRFIHEKSEIPDQVTISDQVPNYNQPIPVAKTINTQAQTTYTPAGENKFISWLKDDWLLKLGGLLLLIGLGWFTTYAIVNNWIGEFGRITLGIFVGVVILGLGSWRIKKYINQGGIFLVLGSAIILLTIFAAREIYNMFDPVFALLLMFLSTAYISLISVKYDAFAVSFSGIVLAFLAPLLTNNSNASEVGLFSYLLVVTLGAIWIVAIKKNWGTLIFASLVGVFLFSLSMLSDYGNNANLILFAYAFAAIFFLTSIINIIRSKEGDIKAFLWTAIGNGVFLLSWIMSSVSDEWQSLVIALWMFIFAVGSFIAFNITKIKNVFFVYAGVAFAMLIVATTLELNGAALIIAYTVEAFLIPVLIYYTVKDISASVVGSLLIVLPAFLSLENFDYYYNNLYLISKDLFVVLLVIIALMALGLMYRKIRIINNKIGFYWDNILLIAGSIYAYALIWAMFYVGINIETIATTFSLAVFTIIGLIKYFYGIFIGSKTLRNYGGLLIGFIILHLLFIDIWDMEIGARVFVFILIGVLLMSTAFIGKRIKSGFIEKVNN